MSTQSSLLLSSPSTASLIKEQGLWRQAELKAAKEVKSNDYSQAIVVYQKNPLPR